MTKSTQTEARKSGENVFVVVVLLRHLREKGELERNKKTPKTEKNGLNMFFVFAENR